MNRPTRRIFVGLVSTLAAAAMPALAAEAIKIGMPMAMSRPGSVSQGVQVRAGTDVGIRMINAADRVLGRAIVPICEDTCPKRPTRLSRN